MSALANFYQNYYWLVWYLAAINAFAFFMYGWDKMSAGVEARRISEKTLLILALIGGSLGAAAGIKIFRHKTRKISFLLWFILIILLQLSILTVLIFGWPPASPSWTIAG